MFAAVVQSNPSRQAIKPIAQEGSSNTPSTPIFSASLVLETPDRSRKIPARVTLEKIELAKPAEVPANEALGSYANSAGGIGKRILEGGGKAYKMTFSYINEGKLSAVYNSGWALHGPELEGAIAGFEGNPFTYAYGQVPIWTKISSDPVYYHNHILKPGQKVTETVWFFPCPPVKNCLISDFETAKPIQINLP